MCAALKTAKELFTRSTSTKKFLIIVSAGQPTDGDPRDIMNELKNEGVTIYSLLIASKHNYFLKPMQFFSKPERSWNKAAILMFDLSSEVYNKQMPRYLLASRQWTLPTTGFSKLFLQANNPKIINEVLDLFKVLQKNKLNAGRVSSETPLSLSPTKAIVISAFRTIIDWVVKQCHHGAWQLVLQGLRA